VRETWSVRPNPSGRRGRPRPRGRGGYPVSQEGHHADSQASPPSDASHRRGTPVRPAFSQAGSVDTKKTSVSDAAFHDGTDRPPVGGLGRPAAHNTHPARPSGSPSLHLGARHAPVAGRVRRLSNSPSTDAGAAGSSWTNIPTFQDSNIPRSQGPPSPSPATVGILESWILGILVPSLRWPRMPALHGFAPGTAAVPHVHREAAKPASSSDALRASGPSSHSTRATPNRGPRSGPLRPSWT
jgi:hypothetical protein